MSLDLTLPRQFSAQTTLYMLFNPNDNPSSDMAAAVVLLDSDAVAQRVVHQLHLPTTPETFSDQYAGNAVTHQILAITVEAPSAADAVARANALDNQFLSFRDQVVEDRDNATIAQLRTSVVFYTNQIATDEHDLASNSSLKDQVHSDEGLVATLNRTIQNDEVITGSIINGTTVVSRATAITHSAFKMFLAYSAFGLIGGLMLGFGVVIVFAAASDRIRPRDVSTNGDADLTWEGA